MSSELPPNPNTPLAFLPPVLANQFEVSRYMYAITVGAYGWDCAINLKNDYILLFKLPIRLPTVAYYLSRIFTFLYILTCFGHQGNSAAHIAGPTLQCVNIKAEGYAESAVVMPMINDTLIFFGVAYRIMTYSVVEQDFRTLAKTFFGVGKISALSRALLQGGQSYYLIALMGNTVSLILFGLPTVPPVYRVMFTIPVIAITNAMACIVFRQIKFGVIGDDATTRPAITDGRGTLTALRLPFRTDMSTSTHGVATTRDGDMDHLRTKDTGDSEAKDGRARKPDDEMTGEDIEMEEGWGDEDEGGEESKGVRKEKREEKE
ncbi:hypothetical protein ONZ45_g8218 [Pleurotus djamor]|nr:hypothetical protein ONZ45_g8218 [Pleurotus djamor]